MVHILIDQSKSNLDLTWANDCTINQENYAISSDNFVIQFRKNTWTNGCIQGFTFDLHHLANPKSPQANFILEFSLAANLIWKFFRLRKLQKEPGIINCYKYFGSTNGHIPYSTEIIQIGILHTCPPWLGKFFKKGTLRLLENGFAAI